MRRRILYYPTINITDVIWLRNALLYWDEVSSIMPYQNDKFEISPEKTTYIKQRELQQNIIIGNLS